ncbi:hypothetical protein LCGC14_2451480 [marine sediment metagenome]|uniref:Holin n=1 Tax=marine sediment metagenome TaxID=412755 RepID=A0A0F9DT41_9ZZZZ
MKNWKKWLQGMIAAGIGAAANGLAAIGVKPDVFNLQDGFGDLVKMCVVAAIVAVAAYLKKHPLPED